VGLVVAEEVGGKGFRLLRSHVEPALVH